MEIIYITNNYIKQNDEDIILHDFGIASKLSVVDKEKYKNWLINNDAIKGLKIIEKRSKKNTVINAIDKIYNNENKLEDTQFLNYYLFILKAYGVVNLETKLWKFINTNNERVRKNIANKVINDIDDKVLNNIEGESKKAKLSHLLFLFNKVVTIINKLKWLDENSNLLVSIDNDELRENIEVSKWNELDFSYEEQD